MSDMPSADSPYPIGAPGAMTAHRGSYQKTLAVILVAELATAAAAVGLIRRGLPDPPWGWLLAGGLVLVLGGALLVESLAMAGSLIALARDTLEAGGIGYAVSRRRERLPGPVVGPVRAALRSIRRAFIRTDRRLNLRPGELVEIRSLEDILQTLDDRGTLDALPFMPEMAVLCRRQARVFRRVEKLNDWVHKTGLHRVRDTVLLEGLRCDGGGHGGCQSDCQLRWKEAWLRRVPGPIGHAPSRAGTARWRPADLASFAQPGAAQGDSRYVCQATELGAGTPRLSWGDPRHYLRELLVGNVRLGPFLTGTSLAVLNWIQLQRDGARYPAYAPSAQRPTPQHILNLRPGELVRVKSKREIEPTLDADSRNRGLRFDKEMLRFCGGVYQVRAKVDRLMVERTGLLTSVKNPCVILEGVVATGEYTAFNPETESIVWREIWLERVGGVPSGGEGLSG